MEKKFWEIKTYTCYCGEVLYYGFYGTEDEAEKFGCEMSEDAASEWWDEQSQEDFEDDYESYLSECGYTLKEISEEEYRKSYN